MSFKISCPRFYNNVAWDPLKKLAMTYGQNREAAATWGSVHTSDHLPVQGQVNECKIRTFNMLNHVFMEHMFSTPVPFWGSCPLAKISRIPSKNYHGLSVREEMQIRGLFRLLVEEGSVDIVCLQECSNQMLHLLKELLEPYRISVVSGGDYERNNHIATLVNQNTYALREMHIAPVFRRDIHGELVWDQWRPGVDVTLERRGSRTGVPERIRNLNIHVSSAGRSTSYKEARLVEVRSYLAANHKSPTEISVVAGDANACSTIIDRVFRESYPRDLVGHHTQIELIDGSWIVAIDAIRVCDRGSTNIKCTSTPLKETDLGAWATYQATILPCLPTF